MMTPACFIAIATLAMAAPPSTDRLAVASGLRIRSAADPNATVVRVVPLGTVLQCTETSKPITVGKATAPFCRMEQGWYFTALTEPVAADADQQLLQLIKRRTLELQSTTTNSADIYELHSLLRGRIERSTGEKKIRAMLMELQFIQPHADAFQKDTRVYADESAGFRVNNQAFEALLAQAQPLGGAVHDDVAWALYQHGTGGECEGDPACMLMQANITACAYAKAFPSSARTKIAMDDVLAVLREVESLEKSCKANDSPSCSNFGNDADARAHRQETAAALAQVKSCVVSAKAGDTQALARAIAAAEKRYAH